jgi:hypothetical protein
MAELIREMPTPWEPLRTNRWIIRMDGSNVIEKIPEYYFKSFKIENEKIGEGIKAKNALKLTIEVLNGVNFLLTPDMVMGNKKIKIEFLDPTGVTINYYNMKVDFENIVLDCDYGNGDLLTHTLTYWITNLHSMTTENIDEKAYEGYLKNKEKEKEKV